MASIVHEHRISLFDKIWSSHVVAELSGGVSLLAIDRHLLHDLEGGAILKRIRDRGLKAHNPELNFAVPDHAVATHPTRQADSTPNSSRLLREMKEGAEAFGITYFDLGNEGQGIVHVIGPELGLSQPGMTLVCADSHTCTHGGVGALSFGIGATEVAHVLATQNLRQTKPKTMRINLNGKVGPGVAGLCHWFPSILKSVVIIQPDTLLRWHRQGFAATGVGCHDREEGGHKLAESCVR